MRDLRGRTDPAGVSGWRADRAVRQVRDRVVGARTRGRRSPSRHCGGCAGTASPRCRPPPRHRRPRSATATSLLEATGADADLPVHDLLIRFTAAFLDQGLGHWPLPRRDEGFYRRSSNCTAGRAARRSRGGGGLAAELTRLADAGVGPLESIRESLDLLGVPEAEWEAYVSATLLALRGWAGITRFIEEHAGPGGPPGPGGEPGRVPGGPAGPRPAGAGPHRPRGAGVHRAAQRPAGRTPRAGRPAAGPGRRAAGVPGLPARPGSRLDAGGAVTD